MSLTLVARQGSRYGGDVGWQTCAGGDSSPAPTSCQEPARSPSPLPLPAPYTHLISVRVCSLSSANSSFSANWPAASTPAISSRASTWAKHAGGGGARISGGQCVRLSGRVMGQHGAVGCGGRDLERRGSGPSLQEKNQDSAGWRRGQQRPGRRCARAQTQDSDRWQPRARASKQLHCSLPAIGHSRCP